MWTTSVHMLKVLNLRGKARADELQAIIALRQAELAWVLLILTEFALFQLLRILRKKV